MDLDWWLCRQLVELLDLQLSAVQYLACRSLGVFSAPMEIKTGELCHLRFISKGYLYISPPG